MTVNFEARSVDPYLAQVESRVWLSVDLISSGFALRDMSIYVYTKIIKKCMHASDCKCSFGGVGRKSVHDYPELNSILLHKLFVFPP